MCSACFAVTRGGIGGSNGSTILGNGARYNPLSYIADGMRAPIIHAVRARPVLEGHEIWIAMRRASCLPSI